MHDPHICETIGNCGSNKINGLTTQDYLFWRLDYSRLINTSQIPKKLGCFVKCCVNKNRMQWSANLSKSHLIEHNKDKLLNVKKKKHLFETFYM